MKLPLVIVGLTAGFASGILGPTHMAIEDVAIMRSIPNIEVVSPADCNELCQCLEYGINSDKPLYIRLTGTQRMPIVFDEDYKFEIDRIKIIKEGGNVLFIATGSTVKMCIEAAKELEEQGIISTIMSASTIKPFGDEKLREIYKYKCVFAVEEHNVIGGLGDAVQNYVIVNARKELIIPEVVKVGIDDYYPHAGDYKYLLEECGITGKAIVNRVLASI